MLNYYIIASRELYVIMGSGCLLWYRFKRFPAAHGLDHIMERYHSICESGFFVRLDTAVHEKVKTLDFDELTQLLASLPHLQPRSSKDKIIEYPESQGTIRKWRLYDPKTVPAEPSSGSDN
jgi:hypothetical protein